MPRWRIATGIGLLFLGGAITVGISLWHAPKQPRLRFVPAFPDLAFRGWSEDEPTANDRDWLVASGWQPSQPTERMVYRLRKWTTRSGPLTCSAIAEVNQYVHSASSAGSYIEDCRPAMREVRAGWPFHALHGRIWNNATWIEVLMGKQDWRPSGVLITETFTVSPGMPPGWTGWVLPTTPIWPGFAINTVFYAFVLWLLLAGPFVVRRWRRSRRGLCPKCAYDLRGTESGACPECGAPKKVRPDYGII